MAGCSSLSTSVAFAGLHVTGAQSPRRTTLRWFALCARCSDVIANASCSARVKSNFRRAVLGERPHQPALVVGVLEAVEEHVVDHR